MGFLIATERYGFGLYLVTLNANQTGVGICGLVKRDERSDVDVGFAMHSIHRGKGYAAESGRAAIDHARKHWGIQRFLGLTAAGNGSSARVLEKLGMRLVETTTNLEGRPTQIFEVDYSAH